MNKQEIIRFMKQYKHKDNEIVKYTAMNNKADEKSVNDTKNIIVAAVKRKDIKFLEELIHAIMDVNGEVKYDRQKSEFVIIEKKNATDVTLYKLKIVERGNIIEFNVDGVKRSIRFEKPEVVEDIKTIKQDIINELRKPGIKDKKSLKEFIDNILDTKY